MNPELHKRLLELDSEDHWETPDDFDYFRRLGEVFHYQRTIEHILQQKLTVNRDVQDAAFFTELVVYDPRYYDPVRGGQLIETISIRFSSFDRMFTIFGTEESKFSGRIPAVIEFLTKAKFVYVSYAELNETYDGKLSSGEENCTWFTRFFDFL